MKKKKKSTKYAPSSADTGVHIPINGGILTLGNAQHQGARSYQEDSFGFSSTTSSNGLLAVLADGMGGLKNGKAVSETATTSLISWFDSPNTICNSGEDLKNTVENINRQVCAMFCPSGKIESGTTIVAVQINSGYLHWLCVGDSRLYLKRRGKLHQINEDHDFLNQMLSDVIEGDMTLEAAFSDRQKDSLVGCIGNNELNTFDYSKRGFRLLDGDILVLCSDGVYNALSPVEFNMNISPDAMTSCENIIRLVQEKRFSNQDNNTIVIISYKESGI